MTIIPKRLFGNLLGKKIKIIDSRDPTLIGKEGTITFETKNMLEIELNNGKRIFISKKICIFELYYDAKTKIVLDGSVLVNRFKRLKRILRG